MNNLLNSSFKWISHRSNIFGPASDNKYENHPDFILHTLDIGFDVEIDLWYWENELWLGHDKPTYNLKKWKDVGRNIDLRDNRLWCHAKNLQAFEYLYKNADINCFWHTDEDIVLTSKGNIWTYPGVKVLQGAIMVMPEEQYRINGVMPHDAILKFVDDIRFYLSEFGEFNAGGICSDYIQVIREELENV